MTAPRSRTGLICGLPCCRTLRHILTLQQHTAPPSAYFRSSRIRRTHRLQSWTLLSLHPGLAWTRLPTREFIWAIFPAMVRFLRHQATLGFPLEHLDFFCIGQAGWKDLAGSRDQAALQSNRSRGKTTLIIYPDVVTKAEIEDHFNSAGHGKIMEIKLMNGFGFLEFESGMDAREVVPGKPCFLAKRRYCSKTKLTSL